MLQYFELAQHQHCLELMINFTKHIANLPILYSFRRCPYAMRTRLSLVSSKVNVELREVVLREKPYDFLRVSPSATVPCLVIDNKVIDVGKEKFVYLAFNKPKGIVCTTDIKREKNNIIDYLNYPKRIFPIGRLDKPSQF